ncbi:hypothetical protein ACQY0O_001930 [Thecaphora frezii]
MSDFIPRRVSRSVTRKTTLPISQRARLVASASAMASSSSLSSSAPSASAAASLTVAPIPTTTTDLSDLPQDRRELVVGPLSDLLYSLLCPLHLATQPHLRRHEWAQKLLDPSEGTLHVTRLLQVPQVAAMCESSLELRLAVRQLRDCGWLEQSKDGYSFQLSRGGRREVSNGEAGSFWRRQEDVGTVVFLQDLPRHLTTPRRVCAFLWRQLATASLPQADAAVYGAYAPTRDAKPPWLASDRGDAQRWNAATRRDDGAVRAISFAQAFAVVSCAEAARFLIERFPWSSTEPESVPTRRTRCLSLKEWTQRRQEYLAWYTHLVGLHRQAACAATHPLPSPAARPEPPSPPPPPPDDPSKPYPTSTILFLPSLYLPSPLDVTNARQHLKATLERLVPASVGYVDLHPETEKAGLPMCHIRTANRTVAHRLLTALIANPPDFLQGEATVLQGEEQEAYWANVPLKTKNAAKKKALQSVVDASTPTQTQQDGRNGGDTQATEREPGTTKKKRKRKAPLHARLDQTCDDVAGAKHVRFD